MYEIFERLIQEKGLRPSDVAKATGVPPSTFTDWKKGRSAPKAEKLQKIADFLGVSVSYLRGAPETRGVPDYLQDSDGQEIARFLHVNPEYKGIFDRIRTVSPDDFGLLNQLLDRFKK